MEDFVVTQIKYGLKYLPSNMLRSYLIPRRSAETKAMRERGFIRGVCHPDEDYRKLKEAHIGWVRFDVPFPFDKEGNETGSYRGFKKRCRGYAERGIRVMAVSPFPDDFIANGIDPRTQEGKEKVRETAAFLVNDLRTLIGGIQISNEMGLPRFSLPLTIEEGAEFIGIQAQTMYPIRGDLLIGYNSAGPEARLHSLMRPYHKYCDYVGVDIYLGCFAGLPGTLGMFEGIVRYLWALTGKPILLQEFGYIGGGAPKTAAEKKEILRGYGVENEEDARPIMEEFVGRLPKNFRENIAHDGKNDPARYFDLLFHSDFRQHFYKEMPHATKMPGYPHTPTGQAKFFDDVISRMYALPFVAGTIIYCWADSGACYVCGQPDCPVETRWGLVNGRGEPNPSYYAVRRQFGKIEFLENAGRSIK